MDSWAFSIFEVFSIPGKCCSQWSAKQEKAAEDIFDAGMHGDWDAAGFGTKELNMRQWCTLDNTTKSTLVPKISDNRSDNFRQSFQQFPTHVPMISDSRSNDFRYLSQENELKIL